MKMKIYDLSITIEKGLWYYGNPYVPYETEILATIKDNGYICSKHVMTSHTGTHLENARHWFENAEGADKMDLDKIVGKAKVPKIAANDRPFFEITTDMLKEAGSEKLETGDICILATGWDKRVEEDNYTWESPFITIEAAAYLRDKGIKCFAIDAPMFGDPRDGMDCVPEGTEVPDFAFANAGVPCILGMVNCMELPEEVIFCAAPLKLRDADGSPVRAFAMDIDGCR